VVELSRRKSLVLPAPASPSAATSCEQLESFLHQQHVHVAATAKARGRMPPGDRHSVAGASLPATPVARRRAPTGM